MIWYRCESIMPGNKYDRRLNPSNDSMFLVCYHFEDKDLINPELQIEEAFLVDGKFLTKNKKEDLIITHWMLIEMP